MSLNGAMGMSSTDMGMSPPDMSMDTLKEDSTDMSTPDKDMSTTIDEPTVDEPTIDEESNPVDPVVISLGTETPTDYYAPEYIILAILYFLIALLYIVHSNIDVPTSLYGWLRVNPDYINLSLATLYSFISMVYILFFHLPQDTFTQSNLKMIGTFIILLILVYSWTRLIRRQTVSSLPPPLSGMS